MTRKEGNKLQPEPALQRRGGPTQNPEELRRLSGGSKHVWFLHTLLSRFCQVGSKLLLRVAQTDDLGWLLTGKLRPQTVVSIVCRETERQEEQSLLLEAPPPLILPAFSFSLNREVVGFSCKPLLT